MLPMKVLVADDHRLFRQGLISLMNTRPDLVQVVGEAATGQEAICKTIELRPDLVLMDILMPRVDGLQAVRAIRQRMPETNIVMLTASEFDAHFQEAVRLGVAGFLLKNLDANELFELIEGLERGEAALTRTMAARLLKSLSKRVADKDDEGTALTEREVDVLRQLAQGASNPQIAETLHISVNTVKTHISHILTKLELENRTQAAAYAVQHRLAD